MYGPDGNCVSQDTKVGPPRSFQWIAEPRWARSHEHTASLQALVSTEGRIFFVMDQGSRASIQLPSKFVLSARDAFNGIILWERKLDNWFNHLFPLKSGPGYMPRRLVAVKGRVYLAPGIAQNLLALDAVTGEKIHEYKNTSTTVDIIVSQGTIFIVSDPDRKMVDYAQEDSNCWKERDRASSRWAWKREKKMLIKAFDVNTDKKLWEERRSVAPMTLAANQNMVSFYNGQSVVALDRKSGKELWQTEEIGKGSPILLTGYAGPKLIIYKDYVLFSPKKQIHVFSSRTGKKLWQIKGKPNSGHFSPEDLFVIDDIVWAAQTAAGKQKKLFVGYDIKSGKEKKRYPIDFKTLFMHQRCYPGKATKKYFLAAATGTEFVDTKTGKWEIHHWARGGCFYGIMPANGLLYTPPHSCACYYQSKLNGFNALAPKKRELNLSGNNKERLTKGPAYGKISGAEFKTSSEDWPVFRHDNKRTGHARTEVGSELKQKWKRKFKGRVSQSVIANGMLFVSLIDAHTIYALDAGTGKELWNYTTGGRVDSSPTLYKGMVIFGCSDGNLYALRMKDGKLAWKFRAAPLDEKLVCKGQLESVWPVHGSILIQNDVIFCVAGRSMFLDGGIRMLRIEPTTGKLLSENVMDDTIPGKKDNLQKLIYKKQKHMPVALPDILSSDGKYVYMKSQSFDMQGKRIRIAPQGTDIQYGEEVHLFSPISFLDDSWFHRAYWLYGRAAGEGWKEWQIPPKLVPYGRIMVIDENNAYAYGRDPMFLINSSVLEYRLYSSKKLSAPVGDREIFGMSGKRKKQAKKNKTKDSKGSSNKKKKKGGKTPKKNYRVEWKSLENHPDEKLTCVEYNWKISHPELMVRAMVAANDILFAAGPPDVVDEIAMWGKSNLDIFQKKMKLQEESLQGKQGSILWAVSKKNGKKLKEIKLDYMPAFDGLTAADGKLFMSTSDGSIVCFTGK